MRITDLGAAHPNTYRLTLRNPDEAHCMTAISTGGGAIEIIELDGAPVSMRGDAHETLLFMDCDGDRLASALADRVEADAVLFHQGAGVQIVEIQGQRPMAHALSHVAARCGVRCVRALSPVLPVLARRDMRVPFSSCTEMLAYNADRDLELWELAVHYESARGNLSHEQVLREMQDLVHILEQSIRQGIEGTEYADRILGPQAGAFEARLASGKLLDGGILNRMILYVTALMEVKSAMGVIVAAPTAGACGGLPGACIGAAHAMEQPPEAVARAMLAAGLIGVFIAGPGHVRRRGRWLPGRMWRRIGDGRRGAGHTGRRDTSSRR